MIKDKKYNQGYKDRIKDKKYDHPQGRKVNKDWQRDVRNHQNHHHLSSHLSSNGLNFNDTLRFDQMIKVLVRKNIKILDHATPIQFNTHKV